MDFLQGLSNTIETIGGSDGPTAVFLAGKLNSVPVIGSIVIGLLLCFWGLKIIRVVTGIMGFVLGIGVGMAVNRTVGVTGMSGVIIIFTCAIVLTALLFAFHRLGVFLLTFSYACDIGIVILGEGNRTQLLTVFAAALVLSILAAVFVEYGAIFITALLGGTFAGADLAALAGIDDTTYLGIGITVLLVIMGMAVQFFLYSRKAGKRKKAHAKKFRKKDSMESEVEKARQLLEDEDEEEKTDARIDDIEILDDLEDKDDPEDHK